MYSTKDFDYALPSELIAQFPLPQRTASRLLCVDRQLKHWQHRGFAEIESLINEKDVLVLNNTKVFPARLYGHKASGGKIECLIERILPAQQALVHIRASKAPKVGSEIVFGDAARALVLGNDSGMYHLQFTSAFAEFDLLEWLHQAGELPLPPYIEHAPGASDQERYQTVFAEKVGAIAAPTAGLHFDQALLQQIKNRGVTIEYLTLHVGAGTFQPVRVDNVHEHRMHREYIDVSEQLCATLQACKNHGGRVIAVGTTVVRALETAARQGVLRPYQGDTDIFIYPGFKFQCVDALVTNFHLPKSTLLMLVSALAGYDLIKSAYAEAIAQNYRFFSYGDAMLIT